jgi:hypothetical protein
MCFLPIFRLSQAGAMVVFFGMLAGILGAAGADQGDDPRRCLEHLAIKNDVGVFRFQKAEVVAEEMSDGVDAEEYAVEYVGQINEPVRVSLIRFKAPECWRAEVEGRWMAEAIGEVVPSWEARDGQYVLALKRTGERILSVVWLSENDVALRIDCLGSLEFPEALVAAYLKRLPGSWKVEEFKPAALTEAPSSLGGSGWRVATIPNVSNWPAGTLQAQINRTAPTGTCTVLAGIYREWVVVTNPITIQAEPGARPLIIPALDPTDPAVGTYSAVILAKAPNITVRGLELANALGPGKAGEQHGIWDGSWDAGPSGLTVEDCWIHDIQHGVRSYGSDLKVIGCRMWSLKRSGVHASGPTGALRSMTIVSNSFYNWTVAYNSGAGVLMLYTNRTGVVAYNYIAGMRIGIGGFYGAALRGPIDILHNTIDGCFGTNAPISMTVGIEFWGGEFAGNNIQVLDNIVNHMKWYGIDKESGNVTGAIKVDYNLFYTNYYAYGTNYHFAYEWSGGDTVSNVGWDYPAGAVTCLEHNITCQDPLFAKTGDAMDEYYALQAGSPASKTASDGKNIGAWQGEAGVLVDRIEYKWGTNAWRIAAGTNYVPLNTNVEFRAYPSPTNAAWPAGKPVWTGAGGIGSNASQTFTGTGESNVTAECGNTVTARMGVLWLDIAQTETNVDWTATNVCLNLTAESYLGGGTANWTSTPTGISGTGLSIVFSAAGLTAVTYLVEARSSLLPECFDASMVTVQQADLINVDLDGQEKQHPPPPNVWRDVADDMEFDPGVLLISAKTRLLVQDPGTNAGKYKLTWTNPAPNKQLKLIGPGGPQSPIEVECSGPWPKEYLVVAAGNWSDSDSIEVTLTHSMSATSDVVKLVRLKVALKNPIDTDADGKINDFATMANNRTGNVFGYDRANPNTCIIPVRVKIEPDTAAIRTLLTDKVTVALDALTYAGFTSALTWDSAVVSDPSKGKLQYEAASGLWKATATFSGLPAVPANSWGRVPKGLQQLLYGKRSAIVTVDNPSGSGNLYIKTESYEVYFGDSLVISGKKMAETTENFASYIQALVAGDTLRREMYEKMNCSTETFSFTGEPFIDANGNGIYDAGEAYTDSNGNGTHESGLDKAVENFDIRKRFIDNMHGANIPAVPPDMAYYNPYGPPRIHPRCGDTFYDTSSAEPYTDSNGNGQIDWQGGDPRVRSPSEPYVDSNANGIYDFGSWRLGLYWEPIPPVIPWRRSFRLRPTVTPFIAMGHFEPFRGECGGAVQLCIILASRDTIGQTRFNAVHGKSLEVGPQQWDSFNKHVYEGKDQKTYVPGDYAYFKNKNDYPTFARGGFWTGENMVYDGAGKFTGLEANGQTEVWWRDLLQSKYNTETRAEPYIDANANGRYDIGETFHDWNGDGVWTDKPTNITDAETYTDSNGNGQWDEGEPYIDANGDGFYSPNADMWIRFTAWRRVKAGD